jgi:hypothetical protein
MTLICLHAILGWNPATSMKLNSKSKSHFQNHFMWLITPAFAFRLQAERHP